MSSDYGFIGAIILLVAVILYILSILREERRMPKDNMRRVFTRDEVIKTAWRHLKKHGEHCAHCSRDEDLDVDHIVPLARGGHNGIDNRQILCGRCNSKKGARRIG